jgi:hypothetical protein
MRARWSSVESGKRCALADSRLSSAHGTEVAVRKGDLRSHTVEPAVRHADYDFRRAGADGAQAHV